MSYIFYPVDIMHDQCPSLIFCKKAQEIEAVMDIKIPLHVVIIEELKLKHS